MAAHLGDGDWRPVEEQIGREMDPAKLMILVEQLCCAIEVGGEESLCLPASSKKE